MKRWRYCGNREGHLQIGVLYVTVARNEISHQVPAASFPRLPPCWGLMIILDDQMLNIFIIPVHKTDLVFLIKCLYG